MAVIDTHAHLDGQEFSEDLPQVVQRARQAGVTHVFLPAVDMQSALRSAALAQEYPGFLYPMLGLHPEDLPADWPAVLQAMEALLRHPHPFIAIGEVGLDLYWDASRREEQMQAFQIQVQWALAYDLPLMIHCRKAHAELMACLRPYASDQRLRGVFHCFSGTEDEAAQLLEFPRFCLGIGGILTFRKSHLPDVLTTVPLQRLVLETDAPYMAPVPHRGQRNEPAFVPAVAERLAQVYGVDKDEVERVTTHNALRLFLPAGQ
ncbi:MAG: TatD family hydrolase [Bacteroidaceae bacterium]|nr:TatD family hydrolase [Bacteroidaceae bacterium]